MKNYNNGFRVFWYILGEGPCSSFFEKHELAFALKLTEQLRGDPRNSYIVLASQDVNSVGKQGVDSVVDGKTPDGVDYDWSKADRAGKMRKSDLVKPQENWIEP